jgi:D-alanine-D-alanine ligase
MNIIILFNNDLDRVISKLGRQNQELYDEETIKRIEKILLDNDYKVRIIDGNIDMFENLQRAGSEKDMIPFVFNLAYGIQGESRYTHIPSILEMLGLPYFGSGPFGHTLALDKITTKIIMRDMGIPTPGFRVYYSSDGLNQEADFPVILKTAMETSSFGMKLIKSREVLKETLPVLLKDFEQPAFTEQFIKGKELALGLIGNPGDIEFLPLIENELEGEGDKPYTSEQKKQEPKVKRADVPGKLEEEMKQHAIRLYETLRIRDYARIDIRMDDKGNYYFLEINSMAGLQPTGFFMAAARIAGYSYEDLIIKLVETGIQKYYSTHEKLRVRYNSKYKKSGK